MKKQFTLSLFLMLFLLGSAFQSFAQKTTQPQAHAPGTWVKLGSLHAGRVSDHDYLEIEGPHDSFTKLQLHVTNAPIRIKKMAINFEEGDAQVITTLYEIPKNGESPIIDVKGGTRKLKSLDFWYDTKGLLKGKALVTIRAMK